MVLEQSRVGECFTYKCIFFINTVNIYSHLLQMLKLYYPRLSLGTPDPSWMFASPHKAPTLHQRTYTIVNET